MRRPTPSATEPLGSAADLGRAFATAVAAQDGAALRGLFALPVRFTAVTPRRFWEADTAPGVADEIVLGAWFGPGVEVLALESVEAGELKGLGRFRYRMLVRSDGVTSRVEQSGYVSADEGRIAAMRLVCSGFVPVA